MFGKTWVFDIHIWRHGFVPCHNCNVLMDSDLQITISCWRWCFGSRLLLAAWCRRRGLLEHRGFFHSFGRHWLLGPLGWSGIVTLGPKKSYQHQQTYLVPLTNFVVQFLCQLLVSRMVPTLKFIYHTASAPGLHGQDCTSLRFRSPNGVPLVGNWGNVAELI